MQSLGSKAGIYMQWWVASLLLKTFAGVRDARNCWQCFSAYAPRRQPIAGFNQAIFRAVERCLTVILGAVELNGRVFLTV